MSWLSGKEILQSVKRLGDSRCCMAFKGVYPINGLPSSVEAPAFYVINTDAHNLPGTHWKAIFIDTDNIGEVFDPLSLPISNTLIRFMNSHSWKWITNYQTFQHPLSAKCGVYAIYYITQRLYYSSLSDFCQTFSNDVNVNEKLMTKFYK